MIGARSHKWRMRADQSDCTHSRVVEVRDLHATLLQPCSFSFGHPKENKYNKGQDSGVFWSSCLEPASLRRLLLSFFGCLLAHAPEDRQMKGSHV